MLSSTVEAMWPDEGRGWFSSGGDDSSGVAEDATRAAGPASTIAPAPATADSSEAAPADGGTTGSVVGTNNQEVGVEEADLVKTDGRRLVSVLDGTLRVVELDETPAIDGSLDLSARGATDIFLRGDSVLVLGTTYGGSFQVATTLTLVSLADPAAPSVTASADLEGSLVTARDLGGRARVVVQGSPIGVERMNMSTSHEAATAVVDELDESDLLPRMSLSGRVAPVGGCSDVLLATTSTPAPEGDVSMPHDQMSTVTVLTVGDDLDDLQPVSIQGAAETVYASTEALFVTSSSWDQAGSRTDVHRFALSGDGPATYSGSGRAPGHLLNQFSLSEREGALRLVTTLDGGGTPLPIEPGIGGPDDMAIEIAPVAASSARLTVLDTEGTLDEIGHLDGMGIGERVQSVRFMDDVAYAVTFRQTDPLYAIDLTEPTAPRLLGELKIPGFSEYLHPVADGLLLGVGRQVDPGTGIDEGLKISLFDVSDPLRMAELDQIVLPNATSEVSWDHRAFLWDSTRAQAVIPVEGTSGAALVVRAGSGGLDEVGRFSHEPMPGWRLQPTRSVMVGDDLWTVSIAAIGRTDADEPSSVELIRF